MEEFNLSKFDTDNDIEVSPFCSFHVIVKAALLPSQSSNPLAIIQNQINSLLFQYHDDLQGIPLTYSDLKFPKSREYCRIIAEQPFLHVDVSTKMLVFRPMIGAILNGKIISISDSHISLLVYDMFNASISSENLSSKFSYVEGMRQWESSTDIITENSNLSFRITKFHNSFGVINIEGSPI